MTSALEAAVEALTPAMIARTHHIARAGVTTAEIAAEEEEEAAAAAASTREAKAAEATTREAAPGGMGMTLTASRICRSMAGRSKAGLSLTGAAAGAIAMTIVEEGSAVPVAAAAVPLSTRATNVAASHPRHHFSHGHDTRSRGTQGVRQTYHTSLLHDSTSPS